MRRTGTGTATDPRITRPDGTPLPAAVTSRVGVAVPPDLDPAIVAEPCGLFAQAGAGERYDHNYLVDVTWTANDHYRNGSAEPPVR